MTTSVHYERIRAALIAADVDETVAAQSAASIAAQQSDRDLVRALFGSDAKPGIFGKGGGK